MRAMRGESALARATTDLAALESEVDRIRAERQAHLAEIDRLAAERDQVVKTYKAQAPRHHPGEWSIGGGAISDAQEAAQEAAQATMSVRLEELRCRIRAENKAAQQSSAELTAMKPALHAARTVLAELEGAGPVAALQSDVDQARAQFVELSAEAARVPAEKQAAYRAGDSAAVRAAIEKGIELPVAVQLARRTLARAEVVLARAQLAEAAVVPSDANERLADAEKLLADAAQKRNEAASELRANDLQRAGIHQRIGRLEDVLAETEQLR